MAVSLSMVTRSIRGRPHFDALVRTASCLDRKLKDKCVTPIEVAHACGLDPRTAANHLQYMKTADLRPFFAEGLTQNELKIQDGVKECHCYLVDPPKSSASLLGLAVPLLGVLMAAPLIWRSRKSGHYCSSCEETYDPSPGQAIRHWRCGVLEYRCICGQLLVVTGAGGFSCTSCGRMLWKEATTVREI